MKKRAKISIEKIKEEPLNFDVKKQQQKFDKNECYKKYLDIYKKVSGLN